MPKLSHAVPVLLMTCAFALSSPAAEPTHRLDEHGSFAKCMAWGPSGLAVGTQDGGLSLWDDRGRHVAGRSAGDRIWGVDFTADGKTLVSGSSDGLVTAWRANQVERLGSFNVPGGVRMLACGPGPQHVTVASLREPNEIGVYQLHTGKLVASLEAGDAVPLWVDVAPSGLIAVGARDGNVFLFDPDKRFKMVRRLKSRDRVSSLAFSPEGDQLAVAHKTTRKLRIYQVPSGRPLAEADCPGGKPHYLAFGPGGRVAVASFSGRATLFAAKTGEVSGSLQTDPYDGEETFAESLAFSPDGKHLAVASGKQVAVWAVEDLEGLRAKDEPLLPAVDRTPQAILSGHESDVTRLAARPASSEIASATAVDGLLVWDRSARKLQHEVAAEDGVTALAYSPDGRRLATGSPSGALAIWKPGASKSSRRVELDLAISCLAFSPNGKWLAVGGWGGEAARLVRVVDAQKLKELAAFPGASWGVKGPGFSPDGQQLMVATGQEVAFYDLRTGKKRLSLPHQGYLQDAVLSPSGKLVASVANDDRTYLWSVEQQALLFKLKHRQAPECAAFSADSELLAVGQRHGSVQIYRVESASEVTAIQFGTPARRRVNVVGFAEDALLVGFGRKVYVFGREGLLRQ